MVSIDAILNELRASSLFAEIYSIDPPVLHGGADFKDVDGIKLFARGFSIRYVDGRWIVRLSCGQTFNEMFIEEDDKVASSVIDYYEKEGLMERSERLLSSDH
jgi:hypothetical protein